MSTLRALAARLSPSPTVGVLSLTGALTEAVVLALAPHPIYAVNGAGFWFALLILLTLMLTWSTFGWIGHALWCGVLRGMRRLPGTPRRMVLVGLTLASGSAAILYLGSWALYLRTGQFANVESFQFLLGNANVSWFWHYLLTSEWTVIAAFALAVFGTLALVCFLLRFVPWSAAWDQVDHRLSSQRRTTWWSLVLFIALLAMALFSDRSVLRVKRQTHALSYRLNPVVTLGLSSLESLFQEKITPCLNPEDLTPIGQEWHPPVVSARPSLIFIAVESLRHDVIHREHQGFAVTPNLNQLVSHGVHFTRAYTQSTHSDYADVCVVSSLYPLRKRHHHFYHRSDPWPKTCIYDLLKTAGYATAIISSQNEAWGGMNEFLEGPGLDLFYDARSSSAAQAVSPLDVAMWNEVASGALVGKLDDACTTTEAIQWITQQAEAGRPFFAGITFQNSHFPYPLPEEVEKPFQPCDIDFDASFVSYPIEKTEIVRNAYFNSVHYCDRQIGRIVDTLRALGRLDDTILVIYGENGECFHENGQVTHANKPYEPSVRVACVMHAPQLLPAKVDDYPVQLVDLVPTVLGVMDCPSHANFQGINVLADDRPGVETRQCFMHVHVALAHCDALVKAGRWKLLYDRDTGECALYDLQCDPTESVDLSSRRPKILADLRDELMTWRRRQLAYYHFPFYYQSYYPPH